MVSTWSGNFSAMSFSHLSRVDFVSGFVRLTHINFPLPSVKFFIHFILNPKDLPIPRFKMMKAREELYEKILDVSRYIIIDHGTVAYSAITKFYGRRSVIVVRL